MGILAFVGLVLILLAILKLIGVLALGATWVALLVVGVLLLMVSVFVWDVGPRRGPMRRW